MFKYSQSYLTKKSTCNGFKSAGTSSQAEEGVILHAFYANQQLEQVDGIYGATYRDTFNPFKFDHNLEELKEEADQFKLDNPQWFTSDWVVEETIDADLTHFDISENVTGILDLYKIEGKKATIADFKTGQQEVDLRNLETLYQAIQYSYLIFKTNINVDTVTFIWIYTRKDGFTKDITFKRSDLDFIKATIYFKIKMSKEAGLKATKICNYCVNANTCPVINQQLNLLLEGDLKPNYDTCLLLENIIKKRKEELKDSVKDQKKYFTISSSSYILLDNLTQDQYNQIKSKLKPIRVIKKDIETFTKAGFKIVEKKSQRFNHKR